MSSFACKCACRMSELLLERCETVCTSGTRECGKVNIASQRSRKHNGSLCVGTSLKMSRHRVRGRQVFGLRLALRYNRVRRKPSVLVVHVRQIVGVGLSLSRLDATLIRESGEVLLGAEVTLDLLP